MRARLAGEGAREDALTVTLTAFDRDRLDALAEYFQRANPELPPASDSMVVRMAIDELHRARIRDVPDVADDVAGELADFEAGDDLTWEEADEPACPVCRPGAVADGARAVRCILHGGESEAIQPTNASADGFRLAGDEASDRERAGR